MSFRNPIASIFRNKNFRYAKSIIDEDSISPDAFGVLVEMNFQMGKKGTLGFKDESVCHP